MMTIEQTVDIPADRRIVFEVPRAIPEGRVTLTFAPVPPAESSAPRGARIGFLRGQISVPQDFDTMGQAEISALFGENA